MFKSYRAYQLSPFKLQNKIEEINMNLSKMLLAVASLSFLIAPNIAMAQTVAAAPAVVASPSKNSIVNFADLANMPGIADASQNNTFKVDLSDAQVISSLTITCQSGGSKFIFMHKDKACEVGGNGSIINPQNASVKMQRTQYTGGFTVTSNGNAEASTMGVNYLPVGKASTGSTTFNGSLNLRPETTSTGAQSLVNSVLKKVTADASAGSVIDSRTDKVDINGLLIPSAGFPSDKGTTWTGNMIFAYQTNSWFLDLRASYNGKEYNFKGNMPWTTSPAVANQTQYDLTLTLPVAGAAAATDDNALFASTDNNADLFSTVDGISGTIIMKQSNMVTIPVDGKDTTTPSRVEASGTFTGTNVPLDVTRSLATLFGLLSDNLFGA
jgi:hypothetical protein